MMDYARPPGRCIHSARDEHQWLDDSREGLVVEPFPQSVWLAVGGDR